jgi:hypothetical protein
MESTPEKTETDKVAGKDAVPTHDKVHSTEWNAELLYWLIIPITGQWRQLCPRQLTHTWLL